MANEPSYCVTETRAKHYPKVRLVMTEALGWPHVRDLLEPGEIHLGQNLLNVVPKGDSRYASFTLKPVDQLAAFHPKLAIGKSATIEIAELASYPLLLLDGNLCSAEHSTPHANWPT